MKKTPFFSPLFPSPEKKLWGRFETISLNLGGLPLWTGHLPKAIWGVYTGKAHHYPGGFPFNTPRYSWGVPQEGVLHRKFRPVKGGPPQKLKIF